jgi:hypothetical protein
MRKVVAKYLYIRATVQYGRRTAATVIQLEIVRSGVERVCAGVNSAGNTNENCTDPTCLPE